MKYQYCPNKNISHFKLLKSITILTLVLITNIGLNINAADTIVIESNYLPSNDTVLVYTPKTISDKTALPAVFLLHGTDANYKTWGNYIDLAVISNQYNCIFICPDGFNSYYLNSQKKQALQYVDFFYKELFPKVISTYPIDTNSIMITGNSMGGYGALNIFSHIPSKFLAVGSISGVVDLNLSAYKTTILNNLLPTTKENGIPQKYSPLYFLPTLDLSNINIMIWCGNKDPFFKVNLLLADNCRRKGGNVYQSFTLGKHNKQYFSKSFQEQIDLFCKKIVN